MRAKRRIKTAFGPERRNVNLDTFKSESRVNSIQIALCLAWRGKTFEWCLEECQTASSAIVRAMVNKL